MIQNVTLYHTILWYVFKKMAKRRILSEDQRATKKRKGSSFLDILENRNKDSLPLVEWFSDDGPLNEDLLKILVYHAVKAEPLTYFCLLCTSKKLRELTLLRGNVKVHNCNIEPFILSSKNGPANVFYSNQERYRSFMLHAMVKVYDPDCKRSKMVTKEQNAHFYMHERAQYVNNHNRSSNYVRRVDGPAGYFCVRLGFPSLDYAQWILEEKGCLLCPDDPRCTTGEDDIDFDVASEKARQGYATGNLLINYYDLCEYALLKDIYGPPTQLENDNSLFKDNLIHYLELKRDIECTNCYLVKVDPHLISNFLPTYPIDHKMRASVAIGPMECNATILEERLLSLYLQSGMINKWEAIKRIFPFAYCLSKPWSNCCQSCSYSRRCPNVYVRSFSEEDAFSVQSNVFLS